MRERCGSPDDAIVVRQLPKDAASAVKHYVRRLEYVECHDRAHAASKNGGWAVRFFGGPFSNPSGSSLNSYSLGDVVCWDEKEDAEWAVRLYMDTISPITGASMYERCTIERVEKGAHQKSINEENEDIRAREAFAEGEKKMEKRIVAWLRDESFARRHDIVYGVIAERLERGEHRLPPRS